MGLMSRGPKGYGELSMDSPVWGTSTSLRDDWIICEGDSIANLKDSLEFSLNGESAAGECQFLHCPSILLGQGGVAKTKACTPQNALLQHC